MREVLAADRAFGKWPWCWKCQKPVESMTQLDNIITGGYHLIVCCHGQHESVRVSFLMIMDMAAGIIEYGWAFKPKEQITCGRPSLPLSTPKP